MGRHRRPTGGGGRLQYPGALTAATRAALVGALTQLSRAIRIPEPDGLRQAAAQAQQLLDQQCGAADTAPDDPGNAAVRRLALAIINAATATSEVRAMVQRVTTGDDLAAVDVAPAPAAESSAPEEVAAGAEEHLACCPRPAKPSRSPSPRPWPSSPASWCRPPAGTGR